ncbi:MAG: hypothetical protein ACYDBJ_28710 [Aggregatilineales bacterium]
MSAKLDWQIEAERTEQRAQEDPAVRRRRRQQRIILAVLTLAIIAVIVGVAGAIALRLNTVDTRLRQTLIDAAHAEIGALRIGDRQTFNGLMRSLDTDWLTEQNKRFDRYQALKAQGTLQFTDQISDGDVAIDGSRGRVLTTELVNGQTYHALWFYWRYSDGWRHVPSDLTFWGDPGEIDGQATTVQYDGLDAPLATALAERVERWWTAGCQYLNCAGLPHLTIHIEHQDSAPPPAWDGQSALTLDINSPLTVGDRVLADPPLSPDLEATIAGQITDKLFDQASGQLTVNADADAAWLRRETIDWLTALLLGRGNVQQLSFMQSLSDHYGGAQAIVAVMRQLSPNADISTLSLALGQPLNLLNVDWREFFQWRLGLEKDLIQGGNQTRYLALWDVSVPSVATLAQERWASPNQALPQVQSATLAADPTLGTVATVHATLSGGSVTLRFRVIAGTWKRLS